MKNNGKRFGVKLHRIIIGASDEEKVDHINRNRLDNRMENLRIVNASGNSQNVSPHKRSKTGVRGVYYRKDRGTWQAQVKTNGRTIRRSFRTVEEAEAAVKIMRKEIMPFAID